MEDSMTAPTSAAVYLRISQDRDGEALGVERQRADCLALAERHGWTVGEIYTDNDRSAYNGKPRPGYRRMLDDIKAGRVDGVIAWHTDRLHRRFRDLEPFVDAVEAAGIPVATVKAGELDVATASGRMLARILAAADAHEVERKSERQRAKAREIALAGRTNGGGMRPYGYKTGGLEIEETEAEHLREAARRVIAGESVYAIVADWRERGIRTSTGAEWSFRLLKRTLRLSRLAGLREYEGDLHPAVWPAVLNRRTWDAVQRRLAVHHVHDRRGGRGYYLLTGWMVCGRCAHPMRGHPVHGKRSYGCLKDAGGCGRLRIIAEPTEQIVAEAIFEAIDSGAVKRALAAASSDAAGAGAVEQIAQDRAALDELSRDHYVARVISRSEFLAAREDLARRIARAEQALARSEDTAVLAGVSSGDIARMLWAEQGQAWRRDLVGALVESITVAPATTHRFDPERLSIRWRA
jgi:DNA invertase Pin-like site-specific DNA recombinase